MRFVSLEVAWFHGVKSAHIDFGPGLNILYGPNDLGKSSLATAIRAALLLQTNSSEADDFHPWHADEKATVTLVFVDAAGKYRKVKKTFGGPAGAQLWFSKDGTNWSTDAKGREVDEKLRSLLPWGIPSPGGKGAPRGWPESFLTNALFGAQNGVDTILDTGLDGDKADSGKIALSAVSALAQNPLFKKVLAVAQTEFDRFFTEKGTAKRDQTAALRLASEAVKKLQNERDALTKQVEDAQSIEERAAHLRELRANTAVELDAAKARLTELKGRQVVFQKLKAVQDELANVDAHAKRVEEATRSVTELTKAGETQKAAQAAAGAARERAAEALKAAEEMVRHASSGDTAKKRELEGAQLEAKAARLSEERRRLEGLAVKAASALRLQEQVTTARASAITSTAEADRLIEAHKKAVEKCVETERAVELAEGIVAYGRWRVACDVADGVARAHEEATRLIAEANSKETAARQHDTCAQEHREEADKKRATLPTEAELVELRRAAHEKAADATRAQDELLKAREEVAKFSPEAIRLAAALQEAGKSLDDAESEVRLAAGVVDYGRWRVAVEVAQAAENARAEAEKLSEESLRNELVAQQHDARAEAFFLESESKKASLPTDAQLKELKLLAQQKDLAEAALGGGVTVAVRPQRVIALKKRVDDQASLDVPGLALEHIVDADRRIELSIDDIVNIEITAGAPEKRRAAEVLQRRWKEEATPRLEKAGVGNLSDIEAGLSAAGKLTTMSFEERAKAKEARAVAEALRGKAALLEKQVPPSKEDLDAKEARIGALPRDVLAGTYASMGAGWERKGEETCASKTKSLDSLRASRAALEVKQKEAEWQLQDARKREIAAGSELSASPEKAPLAANLAVIEAGLSAVNNLVLLSLEAQAKAKDARAEVEVLRGKAALLEKQVPPSKEDLSGKEARIGSRSREVLSEHFTSMGPTWETQCEGLRVAKTKTLQELRDGLAEIVGKQKETDWNLQDSQKRQAAAAAELPPLIETLGGEPLPVQRKIAVELDANAKAATQLKAAVEGLSAGGASAMDSANKVLADANTGVEARKAELLRAEEAVAEAQARLHARQGEVKALQEQLATMNRSAIVVRLGDVQKEVQAFGDDATVSESDLRAAELAVDKAEALFDEAREGFLKAEGALMSIAGPMTKERVEQLEEAILAAKVRERELCVDADAWRMLRDALREAETSESAHLGKALGAPVSARFAALTQGKYGSVALDQELRTESVMLPGAEKSGRAVLEALSVGTKDQLATLVRLAVASQLKSAILLDDQLVHTDPRRLAWFADVLRKVAHEGDVQMLVFTCRPLDYLKETDLAGAEPIRDVGQIHVIDLSRVIWRQPVDLSPFTISELIVDGRTTSLVPPLTISPDIDDETGNQLVAACLPFPFTLRGSSRELLKEDFASRLGAALREFPDPEAAGLSGGERALSSLLKQRVVQ